VLPAALETVTGIAQCDHSSPAGAEAKGIIAATVTHFGSQWQLHDRQMTERGYMVKRYTWQAQNMRGKSAKQLMFRANERGLLPEKVGVCACHRMHGLYAFADYWTCPFAKTTNVQAYTGAESDSTDTGGIFTPAVWYCMSTSLQQLLLLPVRKATDAALALAAAPDAAVAEQIVAAVMKVYEARQAAAGTPRRRGRSRSKQQLPGSSGSSKRSAETPGVRSSSKQVQGTKRQRVVAGAITSIKSYFLGWGCGCSSVVLIK
jgi:hypothetical protein